MQKLGAFLVFLVVVSGCVGYGESQMVAKQAKSGDDVLVNYVGKFEDGKLFDTSIESAARESRIYSAQRTYEPLEVKLGTGAVIKGFDDALVGMKVGETKTVTIAPVNGYGETDPNMVISVPLAQLSQAGIDATVGATVGTQSGARGVITAVGNENATIDFNHPLAGKTLVFTVTLVSIKN